MQLSEQSSGALRALSCLILLLCRDVDVHACARERDGMRHAVAALCRMMPNAERAFSPAFLAGSASRNPCWIVSHGLGTAGHGQRRAQGPIPKRAAAGACGLFQRRLSQGPPSGPWLQRTATEQLSFRFSERPTDLDGLSLQQNHVHAQSQRCRTDD